MGKIVSRQRILRGAGEGAEEVACKQTKADNMLRDYDDIVEISQTEFLRFTQNAITLIEIFAAIAAIAHHGPGLVGRRVMMSRC